MSPIRCVLLNTHPDQNDRNRFSFDEARPITSDYRCFPASLAEAILGCNTGVKQRAHKRLADHLWVRPLARFLYLYLWKWRFLNGRAGFKYCVLMAFYDYSIELKVIEQRHLNVEAQAWSTVCRKNRKSPSMRQSSPSSWR